MRCGRHEFKGNKEKSIENCIFHLDTLGQFISIRLDVNVMIPVKRSGHAYRECIMNMQVVVKLNCVLVCKKCAFQG